MNYEEAISYLYGLSDIERTRDVSAPPPRFNLDRVRVLLKLIGDPQNEFASIHIAGTKGKGSVSAMLDAILRAANHRVGKFTSPHLHHFSERITVDDEPISEEEFANVATEVRAAAEKITQDYSDLGRLTTFEVTTAIASRAFAERGVELAILETGMGGRLDATNVVMPVVAILTTISIDHTQFLGDSLLAIASEKAGIIKKGVAVVSSTQEATVIELIRQKSHEMKAPLVEVGSDVRWTANKDETITIVGRLGVHSHLKLSLAGDHQRDNASAAIAAVEVLIDKGFSVSEEAIRNGLANVWWPGRMETVSLSPQVIVDGAHNVDSAQKLASELAKALVPRLPTTSVRTHLVLIVGISFDKDIAGIIQALVTPLVNELSPLAVTFIATRAHHPRSTPIETIAIEARKHCASVYTAPDLDSALQLAREFASPDGVICVTGSLFVVAEAREAVGLKTARERLSFDSDIPTANTKN